MRHSTQKPMMFAGALFALAAIGAHAQPLYRSVGPDGRVTFSDRAPMERPAEPRAASSAGASAPAALPYELREAASRYPVTLYSGKDCDPCSSARSLLTARGVPFTERTVTTNQDIAALKSVSGEQTLPFGTIGGQHLKGFSDAEWTRYLDAAGYPKQSQLPPGYRHSEPTPLVEIKRIAPVAPAAPAAAQNANTDTYTPPQPAQNSNPAGIRF